MDSIQTPTVVTKILSVANKLAPIAGVAHGFLAEPMADGRGFGGIAEYINNRVIMGVDGPGLLQGHIANPLITTQMAIGAPDRYPIMHGIITGAIGWLGEKIGKSVDAGMPGELISGFGKFMKRYGFAATASSVVAAWIYLAPYNPTGATGTTQHTQGSGQSRGQSHGATNTYWQVRGGAQVRNSTGAVDVYPT
jgi:hypothetical protein